MQRRVAVIGGGIAGLTAALRRSAAGDQVVLFEAGAKVGGQLSSESADGFVIEHGAEGFVARSQAVPALAAETGLTERLVDQLVQRSFRYDAGQLILLAPGEAGRLLGFQVATEELGRGVRSFWLGMAELPRQLALVLQARAELRVSTLVTSLARTASGVALTFAGKSEVFDSVLVATTARSAAALLGETFGAPALALGESQLLSSLTVTLAFRREHVAHPLDGTGFIVPNPEALGGVRAVTFMSSKLPNRAPLNMASLRLFFRPSAQDLHALSDRDWAERAERALARALPLAGTAEKAWVSRWPSALPVFDEPHRARVAALEAALLPHPIRLAGAAFHGSGIDAAIRSGETAGRNLALA